MRLRLALWGVEARIAGLLVAEGLLTGGVPFWMAYLSPWYLLYFWYFGGGIRFAHLGAYGIALAIAIVWRIRSGCDDTAPPEPLPVDWSEQERFARLCGEVAREIHHAIPTAGYATLSPVMWQSYGCDAARLRETRSGTGLPLGCLGIWSVSDLRCFLAHSAVCRRPPLGLFAPALGVMNRLGADSFQNAGQGISSWRTRNLERLVNAFAWRLTEWRLLADIEADQRVARVYGAATVADWAQRNASSAVSAANCLAAVIAPAASAGHLLPIAEACRAQHEALAPLWTEALAEEMRQTERELPNAGVVNTLVLRLGALQASGGAAAPYDPRSAATLFDGLERLEEAALRNEAPSLAPDLRRVEIAGLGAAVLLPQMRQEAARNSAILGGKTILDLPELIAAARELAAVYCEGPRNLFARNQREAMIPRLLASFLATELADRGWTAAYSVEQGLALRKGDVQIRPEEVVRALSAGEMSRTEYEALAGLVCGPEAPLPFRSIADADT